MTDFAGPIVWEPDTDTIARAHLTRFLKEHSLSSFDDLWQRSCRDVDWFTDAVLRYLDVRFRTPYERVVDLSRGPAWPRWCVGGSMNIVDTCLPVDRRLSPPDTPAVLYEAEFGEVRSLSYAELDRPVAQAAPRGRGPPQPPSPPGAASSHSSRPPTKRAGRFPACATCSSSVTWATGCRCRPDMTTGGPSWWVHSRSPPPPNPPRPKTH